MAQRVRPGVRHVLDDRTLVSTRPDRAEETTRLVAVLAAKNRLNLVIVFWRHSHGTPDISERRW
jgi:hypothetical protein